MDTQKEKVQVIIISNEEVLQLQLTDIRSGKYQNVTGSVEDDESFVEAARRELLEETGIIYPVIDLKTEFIFIDQYQSRVIEKCFLALLDQKPEIKIAKEEHQSYRWSRFDHLNINDYQYKTHYDLIIKCIKNLPTYYSLS